jgi:hypothetical protein
MRPMQQYSVVKADPHRSTQMSTVLQWVERFPCGPLEKQNVVGHRRDHAGNIVTQADFDAKERKAHVCPFVRDALDIDNVWLEESALTESDQTDIEALLQSQIGPFLKTAPAYTPSATGMPAAMPALLKTFVTVFPRVLYKRGSLPLFETIRTTIKVQFVKQGMMLGQFYKGCPQGGIYNPLFTPLSAPWPAFVIRYMVKGDSIFNSDNPVWFSEYQKYFP